MEYKEIIEQAFEDAELLSDTAKELLLQYRLNYCYRPGCIAVICQFFGYSEEECKKIAEYLGSHF